MASSANIEASAQARCTERSQARVLTFFLAGRDKGRPTPHLASRPITIRPLSRMEATRTA
jgi:hypothetical protein